MMSVEQIANITTQAAVEAERRLRRAAEQEAQQAREQVLRIGRALCREALDTRQHESARALDLMPLEELSSLIIDVVGRVLDDVDLGQVDARQTCRRLEAGLAQAQREVSALRTELAQARQTAQTADNARRTAEQTSSDLKARLNRAEAMSRQQSAVIEQMRKQIELLRQENDRLQNKSEAQARPSTTAVQSPSLAASPTAVTPLALAPSQSVPVEPVAVAAPEQASGAVVTDDWIRAWQSSPTFERQWVIVRILGETGECRRTKVAEAVAQPFQVEPDSGSVRRCIQSLQEAGLIFLEEVKTIARGRSPLLLGLTPKGCQAYRALSGLEPRPLFEQLRDRHKSLEHLYLNLEVADILRDAGYDVDLTPPTMTLADGSKFAPDLSATRGGQTVYVECERDTRKDDAWQRKWEIACMATGGVICVATPDRAAMNIVGSAIRHQMTGQNIKLFMTNLDDVRSGRRSPAGDIWFERPDRI